MILTWTLGTQTAAHGPMAVAALKKGAFHFIEKPRPPSASTSDASGVSSVAATSPAVASAVRPVSTPSR